MLSLQTLHARDRPPHPAHALCANKPTSPQKRRGSCSQTWRSLGQLGMTVFSLASVSLLPWERSGRTL